MKDRLHHLQATLPANVEANRAYPGVRFLLLNYNCPDERTEPWVLSTFADEIRSGTLTYLVYRGREEFDMSHSRNMAFRHAPDGIVCNVDADNFTGPHFAPALAALVRPGRSFVAVPPGNSKVGATGRIAVDRRDWARVGGYDERFVGWGYEDRDFIDRLSRSGLQRVHVPDPRMLRVIKHSDSLRTKHFPVPSREASARANRDLLLGNRRENRVRANPEGSGKGDVLRPTVGRSSERLSHITALT